MIEAPICEEKKAPNPTMKELLDKAHSLGFEVNKIELLQTPTEDDRQAVVCVSIKLAGRPYSGLGCASEDNVSQQVSTNLVGVAETRALVRRSVGSIEITERP